MQYGKAINVLELVNSSRYAPVQLPDKGEIKEAIWTVAALATVNSCTKRALHGAIWWIVENGGLENV